MEKDSLSGEYFYGEVRYKEESGELDVCLKTKGFAGVRGMENLVMRGGRRWIYEKWFSKV